MAQRSFLVRWLRTTALLLVLGVAAGTGLFYLHGRRTEADRLFKLLPPGTGNVIAARHLDGLLAALDHLAQDPHAPPELRQFRSDLRTQGQPQLGFDPGDPQGWRKAGVDPSGSFAVATSDHPDDGLAFIYVPLLDEAAARALLAKLLQAQGAHLERGNGEGPAITHVTWPARGAAGYVACAFAVEDGYLVIAGSVEPLDAEAALQKQLASRGLEALPAFRAVRAAVGEPWLVFDYTAPSFIQHQLELQHAEAALGTWVSQGVGAALELDDAHAEFRVRGLGASGFTNPALAAPQPPADHLGGAPVLAARLSLDLRAVLSGLKKDPRGQTDLQALQRQLQPSGVDLEKDLLEPLDGQITLGLLPPDPQDASLFDAVAVLGARDAPHVLEKLGALAAGWGFHVDDGWLVGPGISVGATGDALLVLGASPQKRATWKKASVAGGPPFWSALPAAARKAFEEGPSLYAWADLERAAERLRRSSQPGAVQGARVLGALQSASVGVDARDGVLRLDLDLYPPAGGFGQAIARAP